VSPIPDGPGKPGGMGVVRHEQESQGLRFHGSFPR
jgi:hypothetical protein